MWVVHGSSRSWPDRRSPPRSRSRTSALKVRSPARSQAACGSRPRRLARRGAARLRLPRCSGGRWGCCAPYVTWTALVNQNRASSSHTPHTGIACGRPSGQSVTTQKLREVVVGAPPNSTEQARAFIRGPDAVARHMRTAAGRLPYTHQRSIAKHEQSRRRRPGCVGSITAPSGATQSRVQHPPRPSGPRRAAISEGSGPRTVSRRRPHPRTQRRRRGSHQATSYEQDVETRIWANTASLNIA